jgi:RHS repeat-associated protein
MWEYGYDPAEQLKRAVKKSTDTIPSILKRYAYAYDAAGNRTAEQIDDAVAGASYNSLNRLTTQQPSGAINISGTVNEAATVTIQGKPAAVSTANVFEGAAVIPSGTSTFTVEATDANNNVTSKTYQVESAGATKTFTYDANGNMTSDGTRTFEWDARNQLVSVVIGTNRSEFTYDGDQRRVRIVEKVNGTVQSDMKMIWCETYICEERAGDGTTVLNRLFSLGEQTGSNVTFLVADHLGSVTAVTDEVEAVVTRYAFDPWGRRSVVGGSATTSAGYTGHRLHTNGSLWMTLFRVYDANYGGWLSEDPSGFTDGPNLYLYAKGNPVKFTDPDGLSVVTCCGMTSSLPNLDVMVGLECMSKCLQTTIMISSGWRDAEQNKETHGAAKKSQHLLGRAADVHTPPSKVKIRAAAAECGFYVLAKTYSNRVHIDLRGGRMPKVDPDECVCSEIRKKP